MSLGRKEGWEEGGREFAVNFLHSQALLVVGKKKRAEQKGRKPCMYIDDTKRELAFYTERPLVADSGRGESRTRTKRYISQKRSLNGGLSGDGRPLAVYDTAAEKRATKRGDPYVHR